MSRTLLLLGILGLSGLNTAMAADLTFRFEGGVARYSRTSLTAYSLGYSQLSLDDGSALTLGCEYRLNRALGFELSISRIALDADWRAFELHGEGDPPRPVAVLTDSDSGDFTLQPIALSLLWHPLRTRKSDLYLGPQVAAVSYSIGVEGPPHRDSEPAVGAKVGWEWLLGGSPWSLGVSYRFLEIQHEGVEHDQYTGLHPQTASLALSYRFQRTPPSP